ncbi:OmpA family protein [Paraburkholderia sp. Tr-20389]|uniref:OmpA family protein n=1 Tax=Paraburkholderia sp. Tr-20389 TaxID=2703903 RepID=UPI00197FC1F8|nr:OmpA family protein [Paraburkholderia sp. Tr-20389]MBN3751307.1 OmpA family protein [Paraburkholderia sp. Tr-20389]
MSINVFKLLETVLNEDVVRNLATAVGLSPDLTRKVTDTAAPALIAAIMHRGSTPDGARSLFSTIQSPDVDAHIGKQLPYLLGSTTDLARLEATGRGLLQKITGDRIGALAEAVSSQTGASPLTSLSLCSVVGATLMGILKQHFATSQGLVGQLPTLLGHQAPTVNARLTDRIADALGLGSAAMFGSATLAKLKDVSAHFDHPAPTMRPVSVPVSPLAADQPTLAPRRKHGWLWWVLALVVAALAWLLLRSCSTHEQVAQTPAHDSAAAAPAAEQTASAPAASAPAASEPVASAPAVAASAPAAAPAPTVDSHLSFTVDKTGVPTLKATVGSEAEKQQLLDALKKKFGPTTVNADITVDPTTKPADWLAHLDGLLPLMAQPGAEVKIDGTHLELSGTAADAKLGWLDKLKSLFGPTFDIGVFNVQQAVADATQSFRAALAALSGNGGSCAGADVAKVLNLQVVNFPAGSAKIPGSATDDLRQSATALKSCATSGKPVQLEVAGYSDNIGNAQANAALSKRRAESVRTFLVAQGVPAGTLSSQGYGAERPVDSNDTESGRFHNRRIEFASHAQ